MIVIPETGSFILDSGLVISSRTTRSEFLGSPEGASSSALVRNEPWCSFKWAIPSESLTAVVFFKGEAIQFLQIAVTSDSSTSWNEEAELRRKNENDNWLRGKGLAAGSTYAWGSVWSDYDPKSGSSTAVVKFSNGVPP
ncbi:MAG: hypothetical protein QM674_07125 [Burkholderiaceae bacterium]